MYSSNEIPLKLAHIGTVVSDASAVSKGLMAGLGVPWREAEYKQKSEDMIVGKPGHSKFNIHDLGGVRLEVIQPLGKEGVSAEFFAKRGEGINHICFEVAKEDFDKIVERSQGLGWVSLWASNYRGRRWHYFDTKLGGLIIEFLEAERG